MPRADVDIFFSTNKPAFAYIDGAQAVADGSAVAADDGAGQVGVNADLTGAQVTGLSGSVLLTDVTVSTIPSLSLSIGGVIDMSLYINDELSVRTGTAVTGLIGYASYDSGTELLTGIAVGSETGLQLEVYY